MAIQVLVLTLPETERLPSRDEAALPLTLAARPFFSNARRFNRSPGTI